MTSQRGRPDPNEQWERWVSWLGEESAAPSIWNDILAMLAARQIWDGYRIVYNSAPTTARSNATFQSWVAEQYVARQAMAIRRQVDIDRDVISLARLLQEITRYPHVLSRERYMARTSGWQTTDESSPFFDEMVGAGRDHIDPNKPRAHLATLKRRTVPIVDWVDNEVAHYNEAKGTFSTGLTFRDIHDGIDLISNLGVRYREMILGSSISTTISMTHWTGIFREPWLPSEDSERRALDEARRIQQKREDGERLEDDE